MSVDLDAFRHIPALVELAHWPIWVDWKREGDDKVPYRPYATVASGPMKADITSKAHCGTFDAARAKLLNGGAYDGLGIALFPDIAELVGLDLDHCYDPDTGSVDSWAQEIVERANTYCEISPSGCGLRLIGRGRLPRNRKAGPIELYDRLRFLTLTGRHLPGTPETINDVRAAVAELWQELADDQPLNGGDRIAVDFDPSADIALIEDKLKAAIGFSEAFHQRWEHEHPVLRGKDGGPDYSGYDLGLCNLAALRAWSDTELALLIRAHRERWAKTETSPKKRKKILDKARREGYVRGTIELARAWAAAQNSGPHDDSEAHDDGRPGADAPAAGQQEDPVPGPVDKAVTAVADLNRCHALTLIGDKAAIIYETLDTDGRPETRFIGLDAFRAVYGNKFVQVGDPPRPRTWAQVWLAHPKRRQYKGIVFAPGRECRDYYNLWRGFAVEPNPDGDCSLFLEHLRENIGQGDEGLYRWVLGWFAEPVQRPERKSGTSLALRGEPGVGKTIVGEVFGSLFPRHYELVDTDEKVIGKFNAHMAACLLLHADEAFFAGDPRSIGRLKSLITSARHRIEMKGKEAFTLPNYIRLLVSSNEDWVVPAALGERRFAVLDVGEGRKKDARFFARMMDQLDAGGRGKLLHLLQTFDLTTVNLREIPDTSALQEQKVASLPPEAAWWLDRLHRGTVLPGHETWHDEVSCDSVHNDYIVHANRMGARRRATETQLGIALRRFVPDLRRRRGSETVTDPQGYAQTRRCYVYAFPSLDECRAMFERSIGRAISWEDAD